MESCVTAAACSKSRATMPQFAAFLATVLLVSFPVNAQSPRRDGNWEVTVEMEIEGHASRFPPRTVTQCVSLEDVAAGKKTLPQHDPSTMSGCHASEHKVQGDRVTWAFKCDGPPAVAGTGEIVYAEDSAYSGRITLVSEDRSMIMKYTGRRLGACAK
jgi:hypothetical protein